MLARTRQLQDLEPRTVARIRSTAAIQLELALGFSWVRRTWSSETHRDIMSMIHARRACQDTFQSYVLQSLTCPLDWITYWEALQVQQEQWVRLVEGPLTKTRSVQPDFSQDGSWWSHLGNHLLQSLANSNDKEKTGPFPSSPSPALDRYISALEYIVETMTDPGRFNKQKQDPAAITTCVQQLPSQNREAVVLVLSSLATHLCALQMVGEDNKEITAYLLDQVVRDLALLPASCWFKLFSKSCRKIIFASARPRSM